MEKKERQVWRRWRDTEIEVSNKGKVRSARCHAHHFRPVLTNSGYQVVHLSYDGGDHMVAVHKMVAECFLHNLNPEATEVDHIDRNKQNNHASNLRYVSHRENCANRGEGVRMGVKCYKDGVLLAIFRTASEARRMLGIRSGVEACCKGWQQTCHGYSFKYDDGEMEQLYLF